MPRKSKINNEMIKEAYELAKSGFNNKQIQEALNISKALLYRNVDLIDSIKEGQLELRKRISSSLLENATDLNNPTVQIFLAKKLRLFDDTFNSINIKNTDDVLTTVSNLFKAVSDSSISDDKANQLKSILTLYNDAYNINILEKRITELEESNNA